MASTVFYSWQSDLPNSTNRGLIKKALQTAIKNLNAEIFDSPRGELQLDQDTFGIPGSPSIAPTILEKIQESKVVVVDVSIVGRSFRPTGEGTRSTDARANGGESGRDRPHPNPNVLIEYGYALHALGDGKILLIFNEESGKFPDDLPFDLKHKRVIKYNASTGGSEKDKAARQKAREGLSQQLASQLRGQLSATEEGAEDSKEHTAIKPVYGRSCWVGPTEPLGERGDDWPEQGIPAALGIVEGPHLYLRLIPKLSHDQLSPADVYQKILGNEKFSPMVPYIPNAYMASYSTARARNKFGALTYLTPNTVTTNQREDVYGPTPPMVMVTCVTQCFHSREIWGVDTETLSDEHNGIRYIPSPAIRSTLEHYIPDYVHFSRNTLEVDGPLIVEMGVSRIEGFKVALPLNQFGGRFFDDEVYLQREVETEDEALTAVDAFIEKLHAQAGIPPD